MFSAGWQANYSSICKCSNLRHVAALQGLQTCSSGHCISESPIEGWTRHDTEGGSNLQNFSCQVTHPVLAMPSPDANVAEN